MKIVKGQLYPLGVNQYSDGVNISFVSDKDYCGIVLFEKGTGKEVQRIPFPPDYRTGNIHCMKISGISFTKYAYCFFENEKLVTDSRGKAFLDGHVFGQILKPVYGVRPAILPREIVLKASEKEPFYWELDKKPGIPYSESIVYCLHVRGFTRHNSSKVKGKGTFLGVIGKIPYLKELGITTLEFQPIYEFEELEDIRNNEFEHYSSEKEVLNYWGYKRGYYYSVKNSYAFSQDARQECKKMIYALHKEGLEVILQFYFTEDMNTPEISEVLRYWVNEYHVDGFHLKGHISHMDDIIVDPSLAKTKIWYYNFGDRIENGVKYLATYTDQFRIDMRKFLKGDEDMVKAVMHHILYNPKKTGHINYLTNYDGFTLMDLVSYDRKHNEQNGEDNRDGNDFNESWNCGEEGKTKKKAVIRLRYKQIKNALLLLFLSQGTPLIFMGDEFGNSQEGNNNPYCQDNLITWLNWNQLGKESEIFDFVKALICQRKEYPVLRQENELRFMDYNAYGYPDVSFHGNVPFKPDTTPFSRQLGVLYCGKYASGKNKESDYFFYIAYNLHWEKYEFSLPKLPKGMSWEVLQCSEPPVFSDKEKHEMITLGARSICILIGRGKK